MSPTLLWNGHTSARVVIALAHGAGAPMDTPFMNFGLTMLDRAGVSLDRIGDSTGRVTDL